MDRPLIGIADPHLTDGSRADDACVEGVRWCFEQSAIYRPLAYALLGDWFDGWVCPDLSTIIRAHRALLAWMDDQCSLLHAPIWFVRGNHECWSAATVCEALRVVMPKSTIVPFEQMLEWEDWLLAHGHQWDITCHGPIGALASVATGIAGVIERVIPGFESEWLDPTADLGPQRVRSVAVQNATAEAADKYAHEHHVRVCHGHTHRRRISLDRQVVCPGTCQGEGRGEFAAIWANGDAILHEMQPDA